MTDPRPSVTIATTTVLATLLSVQMSFLSSSFIQQAKDATLVHKEVLREYDTKYVHPRTQPLMRDVSTQFSEENAARAGSDAKYNTIMTGTPTYIINRGFRTSPNPNYAGHVDPEALSPRRQTPTMSSYQQTPFQTPSKIHDASPLVRPHTPSMRQPQFRPTPSRTTTGASGDGGSLGVFSHVNSPLRKSTSASLEGRVRNNADMYLKERASGPMRRQASPLKRSSVAGDAGPLTPGRRPSHLSTRRETGRF